MNWWGLMLAVLPHRTRLRLSPTYRAGWWFVSGSKRRFARQIRHG